MKQILVAVLAGVVLVGIPTIGKAQEPTLKSIHIQFHTTKDDKDKDTKLNVWVKLNKDIIGEKLNFAGDNMRFDNNSNSAMFELQKVAAVKKGDVKKGVQAKIRMETKDGGDDNWWFKFTLTCEFSNGTRVMMTSGETRFDDDEKTEEDFDLQPN